MPKLKNIIIFAVIAIIFILIYVFFIRKPDNTATLISSSVTPVVSGTVTTDNNPSVAQDFLALLLGVKSIKLDDAIFSDNAFIGLRDSSIILTPDGTEGRPNPFAPFGVDIVAPPPTTPGTPTTPASTPASTPSSSPTPTTPTSSPTPTTPAPASTPSSSPTPTTPTPTPTPTTPTPRPPSGATPTPFPPPVNP